MYDEGSHLAPEIIQEITNEKDTHFFGQLEEWEPDHIDAKSDNHEEIIHESQLEEEAKNGSRRPRRKLARPSFADLNENGWWHTDNQDDDEYRLIKCNQFEGGQENQPMRVYLSFQSLLVMNIHAHLFSNEIIGFNAGHIFKHRSGKQALYIHDVYPVSPIEDTAADRSKSVEMDPESSQRVQRLAESRGQTIWGWYHSHPIFDTNPSNIDICNQNMYQKIFDNHDKKPFVGFIVGPYSPKLNSNKVVSEFTCFKVEDSSDKTMPFELNVNMVPQAKITQRIIDDIMEIYTLSTTAKDRVLLSEKWKGKMKRSEKLRKWIRGLIKQNNQLLADFDKDEYLDFDTQFWAIAAASAFDDSATMDISEKNLINSLSKIWDVAPKKPKPKVNKICLKISGEDPVIISTEPAPKPPKSKEKKEKKKKEEPKPEKKREKKAQVKKAPEKKPEPKVKKKPVPKPKPKPGPPKIYKQFRVERNVRRPALVKSNSKRSNQ